MKTPQAIAAQAQTLIDESEQHSVPIPLEKLARLSVEFMTAATTDPREADNTASEDY